MRIYRLTYEEVARYASHVILSDIQRIIQREVLPNFTDWDVTVTRYYDSEPWPSDFKYEIKFYNKLAEEYNEDLHNTFTENYFRKRVYDFDKEYILTRAQIKDYIDHLSVEQQVIDKLRSYYNDDNYRWRLSFNPNNSIYDWYLHVWQDEYCVYNDRIMLEWGLEILNGHEPSDSCEPSQVSETSEPDVEKVVNDVRSNSDVWYLSKRQLRDYYDNMSSYSNKVERAIRDYDNYCVRIEKADDVYTLIIDRMQPDIARNFYVATIDRHIVNTILGIQPDENTCDCDSDIEEINVNGEIEDEDPVRDNDLCEECRSDEEVEDRPMSEDIDSLFTEVNGQLRRLLLRNEFAKYRQTLTLRNYKIDDIYNNYDNYYVYIIKEDSSDRYYIIADRIIPCPYTSGYYTDAFGNNDCLARYFGQDFVNKFNEVYEEHNRTINTSNTAEVTVDWHGILRDHSRRLPNELPDGFAIYRGVPCRLLRKNEFEQYATRLNGGFSLQRDTTVSKIYNNYNNYNVYITREPSQYGNPFRLTVNQIYPFKEYYWLDGFTDLDLAVYFGEEFARQIKDILPEQSDQVRFDGCVHSVNGIRANDHYRRYLTKDEFMTYACHIRFNSICRSQIDNILNHYENYIVYISRETTRGGSPYKLNVIDVATNESYYWDGFSNVALTNCFDEDVVRDVHALDSGDGVSITPRELFAAHYMQSPATLAIADDTPASNNAGEEEPVSDEIRTIDQLVIALDKLRQQRIAKLDALPIACASNMNRHEQYDYDDTAFNDNLLVNIDNLINSLNTVRRRSDM